jgi:hypothetical protein
MAGPLDADGCLYSGLVTVSAAGGAIDAIYIEDAFDVEGKHFFDDGQIASAVGECFEID